MFLIIVREMSGLVRPYGFRSSSSSVGSSVARASDARVSMMRLTHNIWIAFSGESCQPRTVYNTGCEDKETAFINDKDNFSSILQAFYDGVQHVFSLQSVPVVIDE